MKAYKEKTEEYFEHSQDLRLCHEKNIHIVIILSLLLREEKNQSLSSSTLAI